MSSNHDDIHDESNPVWSPDEPEEAFGFDELPMQDQANYITVDRQVFHVAVYIAPESRTMEISVNATTADLARLEALNKAEQWCDHDRKHLYARDVTE